MTVHDPFIESVEVQLSALKSCLADVEKWCFKEVLRLRGFELLSRDGDGEDTFEFQRCKMPSNAFMTDHLRLTDVCVNVSFVLRRSDPTYDENSDNFLWQFVRPVHGLRFDKCQLWSKGNYLFDKLQANLPMGLQDMQHIGQVFVDVKYTGSHVSPSLSTSDFLAFSPLTPYLWQDQNVNTRLRHQRQQHESDVSKPIDQDEATSGGPDDLSHEEMAHCERVNNALVAGAVHTKKIARLLDSVLQARVRDPFDDLDDYEIESVFEHWLHPMDRVTLQRADRLLIQQSGLACKGSCDNSTTELEDPNYDWAEGTYRDKFPFKHSYLFHDLYDHHYLSVKDIPRIDRVGTKVEVWLQRFFTV
jgi:hypothetical protein